MALDRLLAMTVFVKVVEQGSFARAAERMKRVKDEEGFKEAQADYVRAVARLSAASHSKSA